MRLISGGASVYVLMPERFAGSGSARASIERLASAGGLLFRVRNVLFPVAFLVVLLPGPFIFAQPVVAAALGFMLALGGQLIRISTIGLRYVIRGGRNRRIYAETLVTDGLYGLCRNPMYVGNFGITLGVAVASNSWPALLVSIPLFGFAYIAITAAEESYLHDKFGAAFERYTQQVPRWIPPLRGISKVFDHCDFHWRRVIVKEYGTPVGWICGICLLTLWNLWRLGELSVSPVLIEILLAVIIVCVGGWITVVSLKRGRRLVAD